MDLKQLRAKLYEIEALQADWDGLGADQPDMRNVNVASWLIWTMEAPSRILAGPSGSVHIERQGDGNVVHIDIEDGGEISLTARFIPTTR